MNHLQMPQQEEIHLQDYFNVLIRRRRTFLWTFTAVVVAVVLFAFLFPPYYQSTATLFVKDDKGKVGQMGDLLLNAATPIDSEIELLKARSNAEKVVEKLHLNWVIDKASDGVGCKLLDFSCVAPRGEEQSFQIELLGNGGYRVQDEDGTVVGTGSNGSLMRGKGITLCITGLTGNRGDSFRLTMLPFNETVEKLGKKIKVEEVGKKTDVMSITYRNRNPELARDVVNTLVQVYLDQGVVLRAQEATLTVGFVQEQLKGIKAELEQAEKNLEAYKSASGVIQLDTEAETLIQNLADTEKSKAETAIQRKQAEFALASLKDARRRGVPYSPSLMRDDPVLASMASKLAELEVLKKGRLSDSTPNHPAVKSVQAQIDELQQKIQSTYETSLKNSLKQERDISSEIAKHDSELKRLPAAERELARLTRVAKVDADIYTFLLQKHEEARIAKASTINNISIVDPAIAADKPFFPKKGLSILLGILAGLMSGIVVCFFREYLDDTLKDPDQTKKVFAPLPMLGVIPYITVKEGIEGMVTMNAPKSPASEAFRALRTGLHFSGLNGERKIILVTSSFPGEGKSTICSNLAITLAQTGARVLVIDCDLRRSTLHEKLGHAGGHGLTELLAGDVEPGSAIEKTSIDGLDLVRAGTIPPNPSEMLGSEPMSRFIAGVREKYSHIVIDAPPVLAVTDAAVLTQLADLVLVVVEAGRVPMRAAQRTRDTLIAAAAPVAGFVVSDRGSKAQQYGYGYGYGYGYDYGKGLEEKKPWWKFGKRS